MKNKIKLIPILFAILTIQLVSCNDDEIVDTKPVSAFKMASTKIVEGEAAVFINLSFDENGSVSQWLWDFGDGTTSDEENPSHIYTAIGEYTVTLTVTDNTGQTGVSTFSKTVTVIEASTADIKPTVLWEFDVSYFSNASVSPAVSGDGTVYFATDGKEKPEARGGYNILAVKDGAKVWDHLIWEVIRSSTSIASDGTTYYVDYDGNFVAMANDGSIKWQVDIGKRVKYSGTALAGDGTIYVGKEDDNSLVAIDPADGTIKWELVVGGDIRTTPAIGTDGTIYFGSSDKNFYAVNPNGTILWQTLTDTYSASSVAIGDDNTVYFVGKTALGEGRLMAFDAGSGNITLDVLRPEKIENGGPAIGPDGTIYLGGTDNYMVAYDAEGNEKWRFETTGDINCVPAIDNDGNICFGDNSGLFYILSPEGQLKYREIQLGEDISSSPTIGSDGTIYVLSKIGSTKLGLLVALKTKATGPAGSGWPMKSGNASHTGRK